MQRRHAAVSVDTTGFRTLATASLVLAGVAGGLAPIMDVINGRGSTPLIPHPAITLCLPAVACSIRYWTVARLSAIPPIMLVACLLMLLGVTWVDKTEFGRGAVIAVSAAISIPIGILLHQLNRCRLMAKIFIATSAVHFAVALAHADGNIARLGTIHVDELGRVGNSNAFGGQMAIAAILSVLLFLSPESHQGRASEVRISTRIYWVAIAFVFYAAVLMSASRGASICVGVTTIAILLYNRITTAKLFLSCAIGFASLFLLAADSVILENLRTRFQNQDELGSFGDRLPIWEAAYESLWDHPRFIWIGMGTGGVEKVLATHNYLHSVMGEDGVRRRATHNSYIEWILSYGMVGLVIGAGLVVAMIRRARWWDKQRQSCERSAILLYALLFSMSTCVYRLLYIGPVAAMMVALLMGASLARPKMALHRSERTTMRSKPALAA